MNNNITSDSLNVDKRANYEEDDQMKELKKLIIAAGLMVSLSGLAFTHQTEAATIHKIQNGETYWKLAKGFGVPLKSLMDVNHNTALFVGENIIIPNSPMSIADKDLMARLVHAEAEGEPYAGKVAVATVILNRVKSPDFPNTIHGVIYQMTNGHYAFTPVQNGKIDQPADYTSKRAVNEAIAFSGKGNGSLYFYNPKTLINSWILSRSVTVTIGNHRFAK